MQEIFPFIFVALVSILAAFATFFSGFGLGTILLPTFALFFNVETAILSTAIVHFANNIFKFSLVFKNLNRYVLINFGITAALGAFAGAYCLDYVGKGGIAYEVVLFDNTNQVEWVQLIIGLLMIFFALLDLLPFLEKITFTNKVLPIGGFISGFFGGFSGHQGALRSAFLSKTNLEKSVFISTSVAIALIIDFVRIGRYSMDLNQHDLPISLMIVGCVFAFIGSFYGKKIFDKSSNYNVRFVVAIFLIGMGIVTLLGISA